jgi:hypothetical protein
MPGIQRTELVGHTPPPATSTSGGCLVLFGLPFIAVGVGATLVSLGYIPLASSRSQEAPAWVLSAFGAVFGMAGLGLAWMGLAGMARGHAARKRKEEHPLEPWYWDYDWDSRWSESGGLRGVFQAFLAFLFLSAFLSIFNWWAFFSDEGPWPVKLIVGLFDLIDLLVLWGAVYGLFQYFKYGKSRFHFARFPFRPGHSVEGGLEAGRAIAAAPSISLTLRYIEEVMETRRPRGYVSPSRSKTTTQQVSYLLHEVKQELNAAQFGNAELGIPIQIRLPAGEFSNRLAETPRRYWELEVKAETPGIDYAARFLLPVYGTALKNPDDVVAQ